MSITQQSLARRRNPQDGAAWATNSQPYGTGVHSLRCSQTVNARDPPFDGIKSAFSFYLAHWPHARALASYCVPALRCFALISNNHNIIGGICSSSRCGVMAEFVSSHYQSRRTSSPLLHWEASTEFAVFDVSGRPRLVVPLLLPCRCCCAWLVVVV